ncbi:MAG: TetR/AcrR family transcriptional regulator [Lachnospiraceae bacterium]|nr:TetR/AcrR family transcriptional regulator [Lachnospiraceae bacterium]
MALEHFYNIKEKKKNNILDAIEKCMQQYNYDELSVNDIVKEADISRGSFYNYFVDKNDAVETLIKEKIKTVFEKFKECIIKNDGKLFDGVYDGYMQIKDMLRNKIFFTIMKNLKFFIEIGHKILYSKGYEEELQGFLDWLLENTVEGREIFKTREDMANIVDLLIALISNITLKMVIISDKNDNNYGFEYKFNVIKKGVMS